METAILVLSLPVLSVVATKLFDLISDRIKRKNDKADKRDDLADMVRGIDTKLDKHIADNERYQVGQSRIRILRFADEVRNGVKHTQEHWEEVLENIDCYERYCDTHPDYPNSKATSSIALLKNVYAERLEKNDFL